MERNYQTYTYQDNTPNINRYYQRKERAKDKRAIAVLYALSTIAGGLVFAAILILIGKTNPGMPIQNFAACAIGIFVLVLSIFAGCAEYVEKRIIKK